MLVALTGSWACDIFRKMGIHLIIDGYNLLGVFGHVGPTHGGEIIRENLLRDLSIYQQQKGHSIIVVFDAWREKGRTENRKFLAGVEVVYTKSGEKADQVIQRLAREFGRECTVVSSDHEITRTAKAHRAFVMKSQEFQVKLQDFLTGKTSLASPIFKNTNHMAKQIDIPYSKRSKKRGNPRKLPKAIRSRNRQLKRF